MQSKSLVRIFTALALIVVVYQFLMWFPTNDIENNASQYADIAVQGIADEKVKEFKRDSFRNAYLDSVSNEKVSFLFFNSTYQEYKRQQIAWGLDLQGGMSVVLQVDLKDLIIALASGSEDPTFRQALVDAEKNQQNAQSDFVSLFGQAYNQLTQEVPLARIFTLNEQLSSEINIESSNDEVIAAIRKIAGETVESTYNLLKKRIDKFGVAQPVVSLDKSTDRITVELPGVRNPKRARNFLQATANLEFWELHQNTAIIGQLVQLNDNLKKKRDAEKLVDTKTDSADVVQDTVVADSSDLGDLGDLGDLSLATTDSVEQDFGPIFELLSAQNDGSAVIGASETANVSKLSELLNSKEARRILPKSVRFVWDARPFKATDGKEYYTLYAINTRGRKSSKLNGESVVSAFPTPNPSGTGFAVSLNMNDEGTRVWKKMTTENVGKQVAVVLDDQVYSAPVVNEPIPSGRTQISGGFNEITEATDLANILSIGKLPSKTVIIEEAVVGPTLGAATVNAGLWSLAIGFILVLLFMLGYYASAGVLAVIALFINIFFIFGSLASFGTVLTLPGIAGIVLTIGMAVYANVIIFERIREEIRNGKHWKDAIVNGFKYSYSAIIDANITTFAVAAVLYMYGLGPIKGFATVLMIGVACSVFAAVLIGRLLFDNRIVKEKEVSVWMNWSKNILAKPSFNFLEKRKIAYAVSAIILTGGIISMATSGFELGIDLKGGRSYTIEFNGQVNIDDLKSNVIASFSSVGVDEENADKVIIREFSKSNQVKLTTSYLQGEEGNMDVDSILMRKLYDGVKSYAGSETSFEDFENAVESKAENGFFMTGNSKVGPTIADDISESAYKAALIALLFIFIYIFVRFNKWQYSAGALAALVHDVLFVLSIFSIFKSILPFSLEIDQAFIAAILTVIGYSINDTVVVFDRIREVGRDMQDKASFKNIANIALNSTISRTLITSLTTLLVVLILFFFGGDGIRGFAFALVTGVLVGTYSSIFIATPIVVDTTGDKNIFDEKIEPVEDEDVEEEVANNS